MNSSLAPALLSIFMVECGILKYGGGCYGKKVCSLNEKTRANFESCLIKLTCFISLRCNFDRLLEPPEGVLVSPEVQKMKDPVTSWSEGTLLQFNLSGWKKV